MGGDRLSPESLWQEYVYGKQTYSQLASKYNCSVRSIQRKLDGYRLSPCSVACRKEVVVLMDSTYWGRGFGVMVWKDAISKTVLLKTYISSEKTADYLKGLQQIKEKGLEVKGVVCDGKPGLLRAIKDIPVQMCQFHQVAIVTRYITRNPRIEAAKELKALMQSLTRTDKESFTGAVADWHAKWNTFLKERSTNPDTGKTFYTHRRLRSAYRSITTNMPWLFTWYDYPNLHIPNTNNILEGTFTNLKNKLRNHNGLSLKRRIKFVDEFFKA